MNRANLIDIAADAIDNIMDMNISAADMAAVAVDALGWTEIADASTLPDVDDVVICTDGKARWLDKIMMAGEHTIDMRGPGGETPTHWQPIQDLPAASQ